MIDIRRMTVVCDGKTHQGKMLLPFAPCPCQLVFDNTHSLLYSRTVTVKVEVVAGSMMEAALVAARDDFTRLEKEAEAMGEAISEECELEAEDPPSYKTDERVALTA